MTATWVHPASSCPSKPISSIARSTICCSISRRSMGDAGSPPTCSDRSSDCAAWNATPRAHMPRPSTRASSLSNRLMKKRSPLWIRQAHHERGPLVLSLSKDFFISLLKPREGRLRGALATLEAVVRPEIGPIPVSAAVVDADVVEIAVHRGEGLRTVVVEDDV